MYVRHIHIYLRYVLERFEKSWAEMFLFEKMDNVSLFYRFLRSYLDENFVNETYPALQAESKAVLLSGTQ